MLLVSKSGTGRINLLVQMVPNDERQRLEYYPPPSVHYIPLLLFLSYIYSCVHLYKICKRAPDR